MSALFFGLMTDSTNSTLPAPSDAAAPKAPELGRNEPCPCGSGKKYKRCHGVDAAPKLTAPATGPAMASPFPGFDPSMIDPAMMSQMTQSLQRLPRGQLQRLQAMVQRAMAGEDITRESAELQKMLPPEFAAMAQMWGSQLMAQQGMNVEAEVEAESNVPMSEEEAKRIVAAAMASGKVSEEKAKDLLGGEDAATILENAKKDEAGGGISKLWGKLTKK